LTFWNWRRGGAATTSGSMAMALGHDLAPIELYTADARIVGWIAAGGQRVTDLLNAEDELRLWRPSPGPIDGEAIAGPPGVTPRGGTEDLESGDWQTLVTERVILAMPPEWRASRQLRLHRRLRRAALSAGPFNVTGNLHLPAGSEIGPHLLNRGPRWMPLTEAYLLHTAEPSFEHVVSVVIVNTAHVTQITPLVTLA
jgi:hypothetical protein